ncbi:alcohol dehydrogenase family protein, partial [Aspergillus brunneoviolaceus CBS 621.78]
MTTQMDLPHTMRAVVFRGPYEVAVEERPTPKLQTPKDVILRVSTSALCGSDLHFYRGHLKCPTNFICGHEFVGTIAEKGKEVANFEVGDEVVVPFYATCQECYYCVRGQASRCSQGFLFGNSAPANTIDGGQAEYVRVPLASTTLVPKPSTIPDHMLVLMADIFPTGYFAASRFLANLTQRDRDEYTVAIVGCGPVGLCTIVSALTMVSKVYAIDSVPERLAEAERLGAIPLPLSSDPVAKIRSVTDGRGADVVIEVVGHADAFMMCFDMVRPWGTIHSTGVHSEMLPLNGQLCYGKNVTMAFGRCPVRSIFDEALAIFQKVYPKLEFLCSHVVPLEEAPQAYRDFEARKAHKIVFRHGG